MPSHHRALRGAEQVPSTHTEDHRSPVSASATTILQPGVDRRDRPKWITPRPPPKPKAPSDELGAFVPEDERGFLTLPGFEPIQQ